MRTKVFKGEKYLLHWKSNPFYSNEDIEEIKKIRDDVVEIDEEYYTIVIPHFTGCFGIVDCTCNIITGDFYPINAGLLKDFK